MEDRYTETISTWNKIAQRYEEVFMDLALYNDTYRRFCEALPRPDASVLELGCGPGNITRHLLALRPQLQLLATDVSENMVALAQKNNPTARTQVLDCRHLSGRGPKPVSGPTGIADADSPVGPLAGFGGIVAGFVIPYLSAADTAALLAQCARLLAGGGILYLSFVPGSPAQSGYLSGSSGDRTYFYYHELDWIESKLTQYALEVIEHLPLAYPKADGSTETHTILMAQKRS